MRLARALALLTALLSGGAQAGEEGRLLFFGDVLLGREVAREVASRRLSPWSQMTLPRPVDFAMANFEGAVGPGDGCRDAGAAPCFAVAPEMLGHLAAAGFTAAGLANNHADDLGGDGRAASKRALRQAGVAPLDFADSPGFVRIGRRVVAVVAINRVTSRRGEIDPLPSLVAERKLRLARALADWVVVFIHWGSELKDWPQESQRRDAAWLIAHGVDAVFGHHPHVVAQPECIDGRPVFFSLGNHVFDQKYPETKHGMAADCRLQDGALSCRPLRTMTPVNTSFPHLAGERPGDQAIASCRVAAGPGLAVGGRHLRPWGEPGRLVPGPTVLAGEAEGKPAWRMAGRPLLAAEVGVLEPGGRPLLVTVERHPSPIDGEDGPRPYVYDVTDHGLVARWRGSALAWPLIDARLMPAGEMMLLCALHRADSFIRLDPASTATRTAAYRWSGFGFAAVKDEAAAESCRRMYGG
jgi:poly-gamma-glutamate synthesis protein (capsule biosynthesis protein)